MVETWKRGYPVAVIRLLSVGIGLQSSWFSTILVHRGLLRFVYALTTPEILLKDSLLAASLRNFFQWALLNHHIEVLLDVAEKVPNLGIAEITPFSDILQFVRERPASKLIEKVVAFFWNSRNRAKCRRNWRMKCIWIR